MIQKTSGGFCDELVVGVSPIIEDREQFFIGASLGCQPRHGVLGLDVDDGPIVPRSGNLRLRVVGDGSE